MYKLDAMRDPVIEKIGRTWPTTFTNVSTTHCHTFNLNISKQDLNLNLKNPLVWLMVQLATTNCHTFETIHMHI